MRKEDLAKMLKAMRRADDGDPLFMTAGRDVLETFARRLAEASKRPILREKLVERGLDLRDS